MKKPTLASLDARACDVEREVAGVKADVAEVRENQAQGNAKLDRIEIRVDSLIELVEEQTRLQRTKIAARSRIVVALLGAISTVGGAIVGVLLSGCL